MEKTENMLSFAVFHKNKKNAAILIIGWYLYRLSMFYVHIQCIIEGFFFQESTFYAQALVIHI